MLLKNRAFGNQTVTLLPTNKTIPQKMDAATERRASQIAQ